MSLKIRFCISILLALSIGVLVQAQEKQEEVRFDESELAKETTLPIFRNHKVVRSRTVQLTERFEVAALVGKTLNDAMFDNYPISLHVNYHLNETHAVQLEFGSYTANESNFVAAVKDVRGTYDLSQVPRLESYYAAIWEYTPYYGKISFTKEKVYNLSVYTTLGYGQLNYTNGSSSVFHAGLGQKLYFSPSWGLKVDLRAKAYQFPDYTKDASPAPPYEDINNFNMELTFGVVFIL